MLDRRDILKLMGVGGVVFGSGLAGAATKRKKSATDRGDFFFLQLSDTHWGYGGVSNPEADVTLKKAVGTINAVGARPDFIVFTGDLTHTTDDLATRNKRMAEFKEITSGLKVSTLHLMPGEHDAAADQAAAYSELFGPTHHAFDHKGLHFVALDNVSRPGGEGGRQCRHRRRAHQGHRGDRRQPGEVHRLLNQILTARTPPRRMTTPASIDAAYERTRPVCTRRSLPPRPPTRAANPPTAPSTPRWST